MQSTSFKKKKFLIHSNPLIAYNFLNLGEAPGLGGSYTYNMNNVRTVYEGGFGGGGSGAKEAPGGAGGYSGMTS